MKSFITYYKDACSGLPAELWRVSIAMLINRAGSMVIPFLGLYLTLKLGYSETEAGMVLTSFGGGGIVGAMLGGWLTERVGAERVMIGSFITTGVLFMILSSLTDLHSILACAAGTAICSEAFRPAAMTSITHSSPEEFRTRAIAVARLAINLGMSIGPTVGGLLAEISYRFLFIADAATGWIAALYLLATRPRSTPNMDVATSSEVATPPHPAPLPIDEAVLFPTDVVSESVSSKEVPAVRYVAWRDVPLVLFLLTNFVTMCAFFQLLGPLPLFLHEAYGYAESSIGVLFGMNCAIIVAFEVVLVHRLRDHNPMKVYATGTFLTCVGIGLTGFGSSIPFIAFTVVVWTLGEMLHSPFSGSLVTLRGDRASRGSVMSLYVMSTSSALLIAPATGMWIYENHGPSVLWCVLLVAAPMISLLSLRLTPAFLGASKVPGRVDRSGPTV